MDQELFGGCLIKADGRFLKVNVGIDSFPNGSQCTLVRLAKRQMFLNHELHHKQQVAFRVVFFMPKQGIRLRSCELFVDQGFLNQLCHFTLAAISL